MRSAFLALALLVLPALSAPAVGDVYVESPPDRAYALLMRGVTFNGLAYPDTPLLEAFVGETVQVTVAVPPLAEAHTFHMHGHPWFVPSKEALVDTFLLRPGEVHSFTITAGGVDGFDGDWMYHCHFDEHVAGGMWGVFRVYPFATRVDGAGPTFTVTLDRLGAALDGAELALTLDGAPVPAHVSPLGDGRYEVHTLLAPAATGVLVVRATHALGESVARVGLGVDVPLPSVATESGLPRAVLGEGHHHG